MGSDGASPPRYYKHQDESSHLNLTPLREYGASGGGEDGVGVGVGVGEGEDATATIRETHKQLLHLMSHPELFHDALEWQDRRDQEGRAPAGGNGDDADSTFRGLEKEDNPQSAAKTSHAQNETFVFDPNNTGDSDNGDAEAEGAQAEPPLPHRIFAADAEAVLPAALTASQLFGVERETGVELEVRHGLLSFEPPQRVSLTPSVPSSYPLARAPPASRG